MAYNYACSFFKGGDVGRKFKPPRPPKPVFKPFTPKQFTPREKLTFFRLRDRGLAGDSDKDRRFGPDVMAQKEWLGAHDVRLGDLAELEKAHDRYKEGRIRLVLKKIFGG